MVDLRRLNEGDYVVFRCKGHVKVTSVEDDESDVWPMNLEFDGYPDVYCYTYKGAVNRCDSYDPLDIMDIVPASVIERALSDTGV